MLLNPLFAYGYVLASLIANLFAITFSFLGYKWFVFKTHGNYLKEWIRCIGVYTGSIVLSAAALPILVPIVRRQNWKRSSAPYIAGAIVLVLRRASSASLVIAISPLADRNRLRNPHVDYSGSSRSPGDFGGDFRNPAFGASLWDN